LEDDVRYNCGLGYSTDLVGYIRKDNIKDGKNGSDAYYNDIRMRIAKILTVVKH
jgi:hypothetical protein